MSYLLKEGLTISVGMHYGKKIIIASDHRGFDSKIKLLDDMHKKGGLLEDASRINPKFMTTDVGCHSNERCDYVDYASQAASSVSNNWLEAIGIAICGSGIGMSIAAAKFPRLYPARCLTVEDAVLSRKHNNSNFLCLSSSTENLKDIVSAWLFASFYESPEEEPYLRRFIKTLDIEKNQFK